MGLFSKLFGQAKTGGSGQTMVAGRRILVVEPSITIQKVLELTLSDASIVNAGDAKAAKEALRHGQFELVISAVVLPDSSGYDLCTYIKTLGSATTPVILLRGSFEPFDESLARRARADAVVTKPFEPQALIAAVDRAVRESKKG